MIEFPLIWSIPIHGRPLGANRALSPGILDLMWSSKRDHMKCRKLQNSEKMACTIKKPECTFTKSVFTFYRNCVTIRKKRVYFLSFCVQFYKSTYAL